MSLRKLKALSYPEADTFDKTDTQAFRRLIMWLEVKILKSMTTTDRNLLKNVESETWPKAFQKLLLTLSCPITSGLENEQLEWILGLAVRLEYKKHKETFRPATYENINNGVPNITYENVLDNLDFHSAEVKSGIHALAEILKIPKHPDHLLMLKAIRKIVCKRLNQEALKNPDKVIVKGTPFPYEEDMKTIHFGDPGISKAVKILRILYTENLRELQNHINEIITEVQLITATPQVYIKLHK